MIVLKDLKKIHEIQQFYYAEARILDNREYQNWLKLLSPDIEYIMPNRHNAASGNFENNNKENKDENSLSIKQELSCDLEPPLREDNLITLTLRAKRPSSPNAWSDNPLMRTRRSVSNIEIFTDDNLKYKVFNNVLMNYSRHGNDNHLYSFQREDVLVQAGDGFKIISRKIVIDWNIVTAPTMALIL